MNRGETLAAALSIVQGDRDVDHGTPEDNFGRIADLWTTYWGGHPKFEAHDVAAMMILLKVARIASGDHQKADHWIDTAGYAACGAEVVEAQ